MGAADSIKHARQHRHLDEAGLAEQMVRLGALLREPDRMVTADHVRRWEAGGSIARPHLMLLSSVLEIPAIELLGQLDPSTLPEWVIFAPQTSSMDEMLRRDFVRFLLTVPALDFERLARGLARPAIDPTLVNQLRNVSRSLGAQYDSTPAPVFRMRCQAHYALIRDLLAHHPTQELRELAAETGLLAGWSSQIDGQTREARTTLDQAAYLAREAQANNVLAMVCLRQADMHSKVQAGGLTPTGRERALPLIQHGLVFASMPAVVALMKFRLAEEYSDLGDNSEAQHLLSEAYALDSVGDFFGTPWTHTAINCFVGNAARLGGRPRDAIATLEQTLRYMPTTAISNRSSALCDMAVSYAQLGELEHSCELLAAGHRIAVASGLRYRMRRIKGARMTALQKWGNEAVVRRLDEELAAL